MEDPTKGTPEPTSTLIERLRQHREKILAEALYHLRDERPPVVEPQPVMLPASPFQQGDIVFTTRALVPHTTGDGLYPTAKRALPAHSAGIVVKPVDGGLVTVAFDGRGPETVPAHCLALAERGGGDAVDHTELLLDLLTWLVLSH